MIHEPGEQLKADLAAYAEQDAVRTRHDADPHMPGFIAGLSDKELDWMLDAVVDEGRRRGFGSWWYE